MSLENSGNYCVYEVGEGNPATINFTLKFTEIFNEAKLCIFFSSVTVLDCDEESLKTSGGSKYFVKDNKDIRFTVQGNDEWPLMFIYLKNNGSHVGYAEGEVIRVPLEAY